MYYIIYTLYGLGTRTLYAVLCPSAALLPKSCHSNQRRIEPKVAGTITDRKRGLAEKTP